MAAKHDFYLERAAEAHASAAVATLDNVRDRWLLSEASWTEIAARSERSEKAHANLVADKATDRATLEVAKLSYSLKAISAETQAIDLADALPRAICATGTNGSGKESSND